MTCAVSKSFLFPFQWFGSTIVIQNRMDYYEELGLSPSATEEDIRKAFRTMSRVLHPDLQNDPATRDAAALQMRRLNAIVDVLLDPKRRQEYNRTLRAASLGPIVIHAQGLAHPTSRPHHLLPGWLRTPATGVALIVVAGVLLTLGVVWFEAGDLIHFQSSSQRPATVEPTPTATSRTPPTSPAVIPPQTMDTTRNSAPARGANHQDKPGVPALIEPRSTPLPPPPAQAPQAVSEPRVQAVAPTSRETTPAPSPPAAPHPVVSAPTSVPPAERPAPPGLEGLWVYAPDGPGAQRAATLYAPEFIQLRIRAQDDKLYGEYSARYFVSDRPISSDVSFTFQGKAGASGSFGWRAEDGSLGIVDLKMLSTQFLQVNWRVTSFGSHIGLGAGTAVLIRKLPS
jgi:hypothetical protein